MGYSIRTSNYLERITLCDLTDMMSMVDLMAIDVGTPMIGSGCSLKKYFTKLIHNESTNSIMPNYQSGLFMSQLYMWSFDLRHQIHLVDV